KRDTEWNTVGSAYFTAVNLRAIRGRVFNDTDRAGSAPVAVVNEKFLQRYGDDLFGRILKVGSTDVQIVGVVPEMDCHNDAKHAVPLMYVLAEQFPRSSSLQQFLVRVAPGSERALAAQLTQRFRQTFPDRVPPTIKSVRDRVAFQTMPHRVIGRV